MKKLLSVFLAVAFALSLAGVSLAQTKAEPAKPAEPAMPAEPAKPAEPMKSEPAKKAETKKAKSHQITGTVEAVDEAAGTLTVKGKKDSVSLTAGKKVKLEGIKVGDKVLVTYKGDTATSVKKVSGKAAPKKMAPAKESPEKMKKETPPPAPPASAPPAGGK